MQVVQLQNGKISIEEKIILNNVNFSIHEKEFVFLIGKVGSGKSSLLKTLYAELLLNEGIGEVCGFELNKITEKDIPYLRRKIGIVFQDFQLLNDRNVYENLRLVLRATEWKNKISINRRIMEVLEEVELTEKINHKPHQLSGGEQQRVVIARALLNKPALIIADEPTGNLDPESSAMVMKIFWRTVKNGSSVFMATHNYNLIEKNNSRILKCENSTVIELTEKQDFLIS